MIQKIYNKLIDYFGPQGWWPLTLEGFEPKHHSGRPRLDKHKFEIIVGAILTQNTNWKNVEKAIINLNKNNLVNIKKINKINIKKLASLIRPVGYFNQKAKKLKNFSDFLFKNYNGNLNLFFKNNIKTLREELLSINGVGNETADSIILYAAEKPIFVIDAYTKRIYSRVFNIMKIKDFQDPRKRKRFRETGNSKGISQFTKNFQFLRVKKEIKYEDLQRIFENNFKKDTKLFNEYHALLVELGKNYCKRKNPLCNKCPISNYCKYFQTKII